MLNHQKIILLFLAPGSGFVFRIMIQKTPESGSETLRGSWVVNINFLHLAVFYALEKSFYPKISIITYQVAWKSRPCLKKAFFFLWKFKKINQHCREVRQLSKTKDTSYLNFHIGSTGTYFIILVLYSILSQPTVFTSHTNRHSLWLPCKVYFTKRIIKHKQEVRNRIIEKSIQLKFP